MHLPVASPLDKTHACIEFVLSLKSNSPACSPFTYFGAPLPNPAWLPFTKVSLANSPLLSSKSQTPAALPFYNSNWAYPDVA